ncbi:hypothetical protein PsYK624_162680 [Phanerochaete sordida]|uniref:Uncharacterized protein n=1 Tax=Phanerochaete sordida TaxID=48140 RepID=A0A9P3GVA9_9APHY|nr:hypothetical protein PsYK624_162680 [Phanerochaete sordida]
MSALMTTCELEPDTAAPTEMRPSYAYNITGTFAKGSMSQSNFAWDKWKAVLRCRRVQTLLIESPLSEQSSHPSEAVVSLLSSNLPGPAGATLEAEKLRISCGTRVLTMAEIFSVPIEHRINNTIITLNIAQQVLWLLCKDGPARMRLLKECIRSRQEIEEKARQWVKMEYQDENYQWAKIYARLRLTHGYYAAGSECAGEGVDECDEFKDLADPSLIMRDWEFEERGWAEIEHQEERKRRAEMEERLRLKHRQYMGNFDGR